MLNVARGARGSPSTAKMSRPPQAATTVGNEKRFSGRPGGQSSEQARTVGILALHCDGGKRATIDNLKRYFP